MTKTPNIPAQQPATSDNNWSAKKPVLLGGIAVLLLFLGLGVWGNVARISGAVIATGMIQVESFRQVVQHPDGGVVGQIMVEDGDSVDAGDVLLRFDDKILQSETAIVQGQFFEVLARKGRLEAEREDANAIEFAPLLIQEAETQEHITKLMASQRRLFETRRTGMKEELEQLAERKQQVANQIKGITAQLEALSTQSSLISKELKDQQTLFDKGLAQASRVLSLQREEARLLGQVGELEASAARSAGQMVEIDIEQLKLKTRRQEEALTFLRELQVKEIELTERLLAARETLARMDLRAPMDGTVYGMQIHALRSVVRPADPVMYIVPRNSPLIVSSRVEAIHIDQVRIGQDATLRFSTFDQRTTPEVFGRVTKVSADVFIDENSGVSFYSAEILPNEGEIEKLAGLELLPGMPVEAFIKTEDRSPLNYLVKPFTDYFNRAFRES